MLGSIAAHGWMVCGGLPAGKTWNHQIQTPARYLRRRCRLLTDSSEGPFFNTNLARDRAAACRWTGIKHAAVAAGRPILNGTTSTAGG